MKKWLILGLLIIVLVGILLFPNPLSVRLKASFTSSEVYDLCEEALLDSGNVYVFCDANGNIVAEPDVVRNGDFLAFQLDLRKVEIPFDVYVVCVYSDLPAFEVSPSSKYLETTRKVDERFNCAGHFRKQDYHHVAFAGYVYGEPGNYTFVKVYVFDGARFAPNVGSDILYSKLNESVVVFEKSILLR